MRNGLSLGADGLNALRAERFEATTANVVLADGLNVARLAAAPATELDFLGRDFGETHLSPLV